MKRLVTLLAVLGLLASARAADETYKIDPVHSAVGFTVRHVFSKVPGRFTKFSGTIIVNRDNLEKSSVDVSIEVGSVSTASEKRDGDLMAPEFFDTAKFPAITFKSDSWKKTGENMFDVAGKLTIKGTAKDVVLKVNLLGFGPGLMGAYVSGWEVTTTLNRQDFGVVGPAWLGKAIGDEIPVTISVEADLKK
jgi:polyisoprenoid-binding protein YceI